MAPSQFWGASQPHWWGRKASTLPWIVSLVSFYRSFVPCLALQEQSQYTKKNRSLFMYSISLRTNCMLNKPDGCLPLVSLVSQWRVKPSGDCSAMDIVFSRASETRSAELRASNLSWLVKYTPPYGHNGKKDVCVCHVSLHCWRVIKFQTMHEDFGAKNPTLFTQHE